MRKLMVGISAAALILAGAATDAVAQGGRGGQRGGAGSQGQKAQPQEHPQVRQGTRSADRVRDSARNLELHASKRSFADLKRDRDAIRDQMQAMEKAQQAWRDTLTDEQRTRMKDRLDELDRQRDQLRTHMKDLDAALSTAQLDRNRVRDIARSISSDCEKWRTSWRTLTTSGPPR